MIVISGEKGFPIIFFQGMSSQQQPGPPGTDQYGYPVVKSEQNTSDNWYSQRK